MLSVASPGKPIENAISGTGGLDGAQGLDGVDEGAALGYDAVGEVRVITAHWGVRYGSGVAAGWATVPPTMP